MLVCAHGNVMEYCDEHGMTVIMVSHDIAAAMKYSDRILELSEKIMKNN